MFFRVANSLIRYCDSFSVTRFLWFCDTSCCYLGRSKLWLLSGPLIYSWLSLPIPIRIWYMLIFFESEQSRELLRTHMVLVLVLVSYCINSVQDVYMQAQDDWAARLIFEVGLVDDVAYLYVINACFELSNGGWIPDTCQNAIQQMSLGIESIYSSP